ncbi:hypothetical protein B9Z55_026224 [Caenorhabditis nigoni]|uniref:Uncharacterized protein n=1 Tax=Caenorhabditis nigoni TaxID=1611254 RepID=A0A2G5T2C8_9PELO|nr:hypothetical protein B9Z55_026224 [Caenorhabditis nigoni]
MELPVHTGFNRKNDTNFAEVSILLGLTRRWCKERRGYTKTEHKYKGNQAYSEGGQGPGYVRIIHQSSPKFIPRYFAHFDISIPCCTTNCCLIHISY